MTRDAVSCRFATGIVIERNYFHLYIASMGRKIRCFNVSNLNANIWDYRSMLTMCVDREASSILRGVYRKRDDKVAEYINMCLGREGTMGGLSEICMYMSGGVHNHHCSWS